MKEPTLSFEAVQAMPDYQARQALNQPERPIHEEWRDPEKIDATELPVHPFDAVALLPEQLRDWVTDVAERMSCAVDFVAISLIAVMGAVVGAACGIKPKRFDNWLLVPNLWGALIGTPTSGKTPAMSESMNFIKSLEASTAGERQQAQRKYLSELAAFQAQKAAIEKKMKALAERRENKGQMKKAAADKQMNVFEPKENKEQQPSRYRKKGHETPSPEIDLEMEWDQLKRKFEELQEPGQPHFRKFSTNNSTMEKLQQDCSLNPRGMLVIRDELTGLLRALDEPQNAEARAFYLELWNGLNPYRLDRIGRGTLDAKRVCGSVLGAMQPSRILPLVLSAVTGNGNDGLLQRFQLMVMPDQGQWKNVDRHPDKAAKDRVTRIIAELSNIENSMTNEEADDEHEDILILRFSTDAQEMFNTWIDDLMNIKVRNESCAALAEHLSKYRKLMPSLALLFHLVHSLDQQGCISNGVCSECALRAMEWCEYLESHARRIYGLALNPLVSARKLAEKLSNGSLADGFTVRDITEKDWQYLGNSDRAESACAILIEKAWLRREETRPGSPGRPTVRFRINPKIGKQQTFFSP